METAEIQQPHQTRQRRADQQCRQHRISRGQALDQQVSEEHPQHQRGAVLRGDKDFAADLEQNPGQQGRGQ
ncbi:hypothetical protein D3C86_2079160 [compost metagenome]